MFGRVAITSAVRSEVLPPKRVPGKSRLMEALRIGILYEIENTSFTLRLPNLGSGEGSTIRAALSHASLAKSCLVIMDDKAGRHALRKIAPPNVSLTGTAAIVGRAKELGLITSAAKVFDDLKKKGFYISDEVVGQILKQIGEPLGLEITTRRIAVVKPLSKKT